MKKEEEISFINLDETGALPNLETKEEPVKPSEGIITEGTSSLPILDLDKTASFAKLSEIDETLKETKQTEESSFSEVEEYEVISEEELEADFEEDLETVEIEKTSKTEAKEEKKEEEKEPPIPGSITEVMINLDEYPVDANIPDIIEEKKNEASENKKPDILKLVSGIVAACIVLLAGVAIFFYQKKSEPGTDAMVSGNEVQDVSENEVLLVDAEPTVSDNTIPTLETVETYLSKDVNVQIVSMEQDIKVKFLDSETGKLITGVVFEVIIDGPSGVITLLDEDEDGIIYKTGIGGGDYSIVVSENKEYAFLDVPDSVNIKDKIVYQKVEVAEEIKTESEINVAIEDTANNNLVEEVPVVIEIPVVVPEETVVPEPKEEVVEDGFQKIEKSSIKEPAYAWIVGPVQMAKEPSKQDDSEQTEVENEETSKEDDTESETENSENEDSSDDSKDEKQDEEKKPEEDKETKLKDKDGRQVYVKENGNYREAVFADYYTFTEFFVKEDSKEQEEKQPEKEQKPTPEPATPGTPIVGIDVSKWNGTIDWNQVAASGVRYVIIRCGYRGSTGGSLILDPTFHANISGAKAAGLNVGIYFFTQAVTEAEAVEEASVAITLANQYGITYPIFIDTEWSGGRADGLSKAARTLICKAFCETVKNAGYTPGIYASKSWYYDYVNYSDLSNYKIWVAQYCNSTDFAHHYDMWQYSCKGTVPGISGQVDMNFSYMGY